MYYPGDLGEGRLYWLVMHCNPMVPFMSLVREPILESQVPALATYATALLVVVLAAGLASLVCIRAQRRLIFHL